MRSALACVVLVSALAACSAPTYLPDEQQLARFLAAGPIVPELDDDALLREVTPAGPYRVAVGDLLEVHAPPALFASVSDEAAANGRHLMRVDAEGKCQLPLGVAVEAVGLTLVALEDAVARAVHPRFLVDRPAIVVRVVEHARLPVTVVGAVEQPGIHELRSDQMTLYGALSEAGGILKSSNLVVGAGLIMVHRPGTDVEEPVFLPVKGLNIPFANVDLVGGETIEVVRFEPDTFSLIGLVQNPGAFEYPPEVRYNLMQALAVAGGVDVFADPRYATIFRKEAGGEILPATFEIQGNGLVAASALEIKPGDVIVVGHTAASWTRALVRELFRVQVIFGNDRR